MYQIQIKYSFKNIMTKDDTKTEKKLLFLINTLGCGGAEKVLVTLLNELADYDYKLYLVIFEDIVDLKEYLNRNVKFICLHKKKKIDFFKLIFKLKSIINKIEPDIVINFQYYASFVSHAAVSMSRIKCKMISCEHSNPAENLDVKFTKRLLWSAVSYVYNKSDSVVCVSEVVKQSLKNDFHVEEKKLVRIYNPIDLSSITEMAKEKIYHRFFDDENGIVIVSVGRLERVKRYDRLIKAFLAIHHKIKNSYLLIVGKGSLENELSELISKYNMTDKIELVGFKKNPYPWMARSDIFVLSSDYEGLPMVLIEAMVCRIPVITTDCSSGPGELIENHISGIIAEGKSSNTLSKEIIELSLNPEKRKMILNKALEQCQRFNSETIAREYIKTIEQL